MDGLELVMRSQAPRDRQVEEGLGVGRREQLLRHWLWPMSLSSLAGECGQLLGVSGPDGDAVGD